MSSKISPVLIRRISIHLNNSKDQIIKSFTTSVPAMHHLLLRNLNPSSSIHTRHLSSQMKTLNNKEQRESHRILVPESKNDKDEAVDIGEGTWKEVYSGVLTTQLKLLKLFSLGSSVIGLSIQPILYEKLAAVNVAVVLSLGSCIAFFTFVTPVLIHWVSKKYVTKLEYDPQGDVYAATTLSFFLRERKVQFRVDDVYRPEIPGMFTSFLVKNRPLFLDPSVFEDVDHYSRIMGYDKPIDFSYQKDEKR